MATGAEINTEAKRLIDQLVAIQRAIDHQAAELDDVEGDGDVSILGKAARDRAVIARALADLLAVDTAR